MLSKMGTSSFLDLTSSVNQIDFFDSALPKITLVRTHTSPYDLSIATARTCYSSKGIVTPEEVSENESARLVRDRIAHSTREAGHVTTRQHAHFVFALKHVSRHCLWYFFHNHPFYNSEQVSQRYVRVQRGNFTVPQLKSEEKGWYEKILSLQMEAYEKLITLLTPAVSDEYYRLFPNRMHRNEKRWQKVIEKKAYEIARYILPIATQAYLYHTVSALTLLRYVKVCGSLDVPFEQKYIVAKMVEAVVRVDPDFLKELEFCQLEFPISRNLSLESARTFVKSLDDRLNGKVSCLIDYNQHAEHTLASAVRLVLAKTPTQLTDKEAIDLVLNPAKNPDLGETLNITTLSTLSRALYHVHFTFLKKLSHTADSQNQRHRMTPATRPILRDHYFGEPDVIYPKLFEEVPKAKKVYEDVVCQTVETINQLLKRGVSFEKAQYLLPNGWTIRLEESGDLLNWHHKWKLRTCYNSQEEIFYASVEEIQQISIRFPTIAKHIMAPCYLRKHAAIAPYCPEGDRYCGVPVWNLKISEYDRLI